MQLVGIARIRTRLVADPIDCRLVEHAEFAAAGVRPASRLNRMTPPLFERRIVEKRVRSCAEDLVGEDRGLRRVARHELHFAAMDPSEHGVEAIEIHRLFEAITNRLRDERVIGNLTVAGDVLEARGGIGEDRRQQIRGEHPLHLRRELPSASRTRDRERNRRVPPPPRLEDRRVEKRLHEHVPGRLGVQVAEHVRERERMLRPEREHQTVFGRRGLQLEVELTAEALAQRKAPRFRDAAAERRVQDELHATRLVEEPLEDERLLRGNHAEHAPSIRQVRDGLLRRRARQSGLLDEPRRRLAPCLSGVGVVVTRAGRQSPRADR